MGMYDFSCNVSNELISASAEADVIRVHCYWKNNGWKYNMGPLYGWVSCNGQEVLVCNGEYRDFRSDNQAQYELGFHDFTIYKNRGYQNIPCSARLRSDAYDYVAGERSSGTQYRGVGAKPSWTVSYNANGGSGAPGSQTKWYNENLGLSSTVPSRTGHNFVRWNTNTANTGSAYSPGQTYTGNGDLTLYAIWSPYTHTVIYNANGGSGAPGNQTKTYGVQMSISSVTPTRNTYNFLGWSTSPNGAVTYRPGDNYTPDYNGGSVTLYAVWELAYIDPSIINFSAYRCNSNGDSDESGRYIRVRFSWYTYGSLTALKAEWKPKTSSTWTSVNVYNSSTTENLVNQVIGNGNISPDISYDVRVYASDNRKTAYSPTLSIGTIKFPIDIKRGGTGVAIGKVCEKEAFEVGMDIYDKNGNLVLGDNHSIRTNDSNFDNIASVIPGIAVDRRMYMVTNNPVTDDNYIQQGASHTIIGMEYSDHDWGSQISFSFNGIKYRKKDNGAWYPWERISKGVALYDNSSGTTGTVILSQSAANFLYLEIYFNINGNRYLHTKVLDPDGKTIALNGFWGAPLNGNLIQFETRDYTINGTGIIPTYDYEIFSNIASDNTVGVNRQLRITINKVIGYN